MDAEQLSRRKTGEQAANVERSRSSCHNRKRVAMHGIDLDEA
jgi:hypothetical protein